MRYFLLKPHEVNSVLIKASWQNQILIVAIAVTTSVRTTCPYLLINDNTHPTLASYRGYDRSFHHPTKQRPSH